MATEIRLAPLSSVYGEQLALSTTLAALGMPPKQHTVACKGVVLRCTSDFRYQVVPALKAWLKTTDAGVTFTDDTDELTDRDTSTVETLNSLSTFANGDYLAVCSDRKFGGIAVDGGNFNSNDSVMTVKYWDGSAWTDITATDGTINPAGKTLGQDGNITWAQPSDWAPTTLNGVTGYWVRIEVSAALDVTVTIREITLLSKDANRGYGYANVPVAIPLGSEDGGIEALVTAGTPNLDLTWCFGDTIVIAGTAPGTGTAAQQVQGTAADGAAAVGNPVQMGGVDASGNTQAVAVDTSGQLRAGPAQGTLTDRSGTIAVNNTSQQLAAANAARKYFYVQNVTSPASQLWIRFTSDATQAQPSIPLESGEWKEWGPGFVSTEKVTIIGAVGAAFTALEG